MSDDRLRRTLRLVDEPVRPAPAFVEMLHDQLRAELGFDRSAALRLRPVQLPQRRGWPARWVLVAALIATLFAVAIAVGQPTRPPVIQPPPSERPSVGPTPPSFESPPPPTSSPAPSFPPSFDALRGDGLVVYEIGSVTELPRLRILNPDLSSSDLVPDLPGVQSAAAWDPAGERVAFAAYDSSDLGSAPRLWQLELGSPAPSPLPTGCQPPACAFETDPAWSPDGVRIAFVRTLGEGATQESVLAVLDLESGEVTEFDATRQLRNQAQNFNPSWSPDGALIAFGLTDYNEEGTAAGSAVWLVGSDGQGLRQLTPEALEGGDPAWSPDGSTILFSSHPIRSYAAALVRDVARMHLYTIPVDGGEARQFTLTGPVGTPTWAADGTQILFAFLAGAGRNSPGTPQLFVMEADGTDVRQVSAFGADGGWYAVQQPRP